MKEMKGSKVMGNFDASSPQIIYLSAFTQRRDDRISRTGKEAYMVSFQDFSIACLSCRRFRCSPSADQQQNLSRKLPLKRVSFDPTVNGFASGAHSRG